MGRDIFAIVQRYPTKPREQGRWEAHRTYLDVQYVVAGVEMMGWHPIDGLTETEAYNPQKDLMFLDGVRAPSFLVVREAMFAVFFPTDAHMPGLAVDAVAPVHKIVVKVRCDDWA